jgi:tetratricopeptide (TPR) repeat protein
MRASLVHSLVLCLGLALVALLGPTAPACAEEEGDGSSGQLTLDEAANLLGLEESEAEVAPASARRQPDGAAPPLARITNRARQVLQTRRLPANARGAIEDLLQGRVTRRAQAVLALLGLALLLVYVRTARGRGDVAVCIEYPGHLRGTFTVKLSPRATGRVRGRIKNPDEAIRARDRAGASRRTEHHLVARETQFRELPCRSYYVSVDGFLQSSEGEEVISTHFEERTVEMRRGQTVRVVFDFNPRACLVDLRVLWDRKPVQEAQVALKGTVGSLRFARNGSTQISLAEGTHALVVGSGDRVVEMPVEIRSLRPMMLEIDLADRNRLLFCGCPPAVEYYLAGDVTAAARALARDEQDEISHLILARFHRERGQRERSAAHFEAAGHFHEAAELREQLTQFEKAAALFEQAGEDGRAAEMYRSAGKLLRAGDAYARADAYDSAVECYRRAGDVPRWIEALVKTGHVFEAAEVALEKNDRTRAIQCLTQVSPVDENYPRAMVHLAEAYRAEGHIDLAAHKLEELVATRGDGEVPLEAIDMLARLLEQSGEYEKALQALERLRARDPQWPDLRTRIEELEKRRSTQAHTAAAVAAVPGSAAFSSEFRYEILEEVGRGGMGIVFKARDRRLGRIVALKRLPDNLRNHPKAVELFLREARAAAALNHTNIVTLFDAGQEGDSYYITMELLEGTGLQKILSDKGRLAPAHVAKVGGQVATGLQYAHEQGVVHRDIKTANLFFTRKKVVKIMDFGLAKMVEEVRRSTTVIGGTPYYMAPEQAAGERVDPRADIYALGVTFFELLTGGVPFGDGDVTFHHRHTPPPDPRERNPDLPDDLAELVLEMLAKRPEGRVPSAEAVCNRLFRIAQNL